MERAIFLCLIVISVGGYCAAAGGTFSYVDQANWPGVCRTGSRQSPINVVTGDVSRNSSLKGLEFTSAWTSSSSGSFQNTGTTVKFIPSSTTAAFTASFLGTYDLQQFHFHWGSRTDQGSEHRFNGQQAEVEIHFVHFKRGATNTSQGDYAAVVGVLADVAEIPVSGIWSQLNVSAIQSNSSSQTISGVVFNELIPRNRDYYYYIGSLTTPPCSEVVQWFLMKERLQVPADFLDQLRKVQQRNGDDLSFNFRETNLLNNRLVQESSQTFNEPALLVLVVAILLAKFVL